MAKNGYIRVSLLHFCLSMAQKAPLKVEAKIVNKSQLKREQKIGQLLAINICTTCKSQIYVTQTRWNAKVGSWKNIETDVWNEKTQINWKF